MKRLILAFLFGLLFVASADAQTTVVGPATTASFDVASDHATIISGVAVVTSYTLEIRSTLNNNLVDTVNLGKPTPVNGTITTGTLPNWVALATGAYVAIARANGPGGSTPSAPSDPFVRIGAPLAPGKPVISSP